MIGSDKTFDHHDEMTSSLVTGHDTASTVSSLFMGTMTTSGTVGLEREIPFSEFADVKAATFIDRIYVPILVSVGLVFNFLCFVTFVFTSLRTTSTCVYMAAIAVLDSVILTHALCVLTSRYLGQTTFYMRSDWTCGLHYFLFYFTIHFDVLVLLAMTVDRFIVVTFPLKAQSLCTPKSALKVITGLGIFSFALNIQIVFNRRLIPSGYADDPWMCWYPAGDVEYFMEKIYTVIDATIYSFIPFIALLTLNLLIIRELKHSHKFVKQFTFKETSASKHSVKANTIDPNTKELKNTPVGSEQTKDIHREGGSRAPKQTGSSINVMFLLVSFTFLVLTSPIVIVLLYARHYWQPETNAAQAQYRLILACVDNVMYSNHAVNFLLYCVSGRRFRQELEKLLVRFCCHS